MKTLLASIIAATGLAVAGCSSGKCGSSCSMEKSACHCPAGKCDGKCGASADKGCGCSTDMKSDKTM